MGLNYLLHQSVSGLYHADLSQEAVHKDEKWPLEVRGPKGRWGRGRHAELCLPHPSRCSCVWV